MARQVVIKASEGHRGFGKLLKRVYRSDEHLIVERDGFPVAVLMSYQEYEKLSRERALEAFERFSRGLGREIEKQGLTEEQLFEELKQTRQEVFEEHYASRAK
jgi:prevent-host-death family protein